MSITIKKGSTFTVTGEREGSLQKIFSLNSRKDETLEGLWRIGWCQTKDCEGKVTLLKVVIVVILWLTF